MRWWNRKSRSLCYHRNTNLPMICWPKQFYERFIVKFRGFSTQEEHSTQNSCHQQLRLQLPQTPAQLRWRETTTAQCRKSRGVHRPSVIPTLSGPVQGSRSCSTPGGTFMDLLHFRCSRKGKIKGGRLLGRACRDLLGKEKRCSWRVTTKGRWRHGSHTSTGKLRETLRVHGSWSWLLKAFKAVHKNLQRHLVIPSANMKA